MFQVDYKRLSEDLTKIVDMRGTFLCSWLRTYIPVRGKELTETSTLFFFFTEKDLEELKQSYENRIERLKHEAETTVKNAMTETDKVVASVKSLFENEVDQIINLRSLYRIPFRKRRRNMRKNFKKRPKIHHAIVSQFLRAKGQEFVSLQVYNFSVIILK